ncbi:MAG TPA: sigma-54 dependent transcriptional regulator [Gemmatimonadales bacterium]|nr:sigma-54 dependent transcriptional regulator [Gemmatimonadales bacterium]
MARILVADDERGVRGFIAEALEDDGHAVAQAADGVEAAARLGRESFDLLITDLKMPRLDGMALLRQVRAEQPELEVIVLTAFGTVDTAVEAMKLGAFDYLQKPIGGPAELRMLARRALEHRALLAARDRATRDAPELPPLSYGDPTMEPVVQALRKVAPTGSTVLLMGESGTGKEVAARTLHAWSPRAGGPFVAVNCAAIPETLLESELFGHEKGAFTGAVSARRGRIELADGGTFFLDEIGEMPPAVQAKLLRVLQDRRFERVGGTRTIEADVRWVAATNRSVEALRATGTLREDLYHRLAVFPVRLPPLRERPRDILPLAERLMARSGAAIGRPRLTLSPGAQRRIVAAAWPGNVRELANVLERAAILCEGTEIREEHLELGEPVAAGVGGNGATTLDAIERTAIERALAAVGGNRRAAADRLGIGLRTLYDKLKRYKTEVGAL